MVLECKLPTCKIAASIVALENKDREHLLHYLEQLTSSQRRAIFAVLRAKCINDSDVSELLLLGNHRDPCQICAWKRQAKQMGTRNSNVSLSVAKQRTNQWKEATLPQIPRYSLSSSGGSLSISFSDAAQSYICGDLRQEPISIKVSRYVEWIMIKTCDIISLNIVIEIIVAVRRLQEGGQGLCHRGKSRSIQILP